MTLKKLIQLGERVKEVRENKGMSQKALARSIGKDVFYIEQLELGLIDPELAEISVLTRGLDLSFSEFFKDFD